MALLTKRQQRECLIGLGWPLDRPPWTDDAGLVRAIRDFQSAAGIKVDGVWGPQTQLTAYFVGVNGGRVTDHFAIREFTCRCWERGFHGASFCHGWTKIHRNLVVGLERLREANGGPVQIVNGYRCPAYNRQVGGASGSQHMKGAAADVRQNLTLKKVRALRVFGGIGYRRVGGLVLHVDVRSGNPAAPATWPYG